MIIISEYNSHNPTNTIITTTQSEQNAIMLVGRWLYFDESATKIQRLASTDDKIHNK